jgi:PIN domain nuclease of toxin-antitoxin system
VNLLLDTHAAIWWWTAPERIGVRSRQRLEDRTNLIYFSAASAYELAQKQRWRGAPLPPVLLQNLAVHLKAEEWSILPISLEHALYAGRHSSLHRDPFDRLLAAQTDLENLTLVTCDPAFAAFNISTLW